MSAETDLLQMPKVLAHWISLHAAHAADSADVRGFVEHYARACVSSATEALRAEVERLTKCLATANANHETFERRWYLEDDRANRFLAALRLIAAQDQGCGGRVTEAEAWRSAQQIARAALEQETTNG